MPKGAETRQAYKVMAVEDELKVDFFGLVATGSVVTPEKAVEDLAGGAMFVFVTCRHDVKLKVLELWRERVAGGGWRVAGGELRVVDGELGGVNGDGEEGTSEWEIRADTAVVAGDGG